MDFASLSGPGSSAPGWNTLSVIIARAIAPASNTSVFTVSVSIAEERKGGGEAAPRRTEEPLNRNHFASPASREFYHPIDRPNEKEDNHDRHADQHASHWLVNRATR